MYRILFGVSFVSWASFTLASAFQFYPYSGALKMLSSLLFIITAVLSYIRYGRKIEKKGFRFYAVFVGAGLIFSVFGDFFLLSGETFICGLIAFAIAQICYFTAFFAFGAPKPAFVLRFLCFFLPVAALIGFVLIFDFGDNAAAAWIYAVLISLMAAKSLDANRSDITKPFLATAGAIAFLVSDVILVFYIFADLGRAADIALHAGNTFTYFPAQTLLAMSLSGGAFLSIKQTERSK